MASEQEQDRGSGFQQRQAMRKESKNAYAIVERDDDDAFASERVTRPRNAAAWRRSIDD
jgi:hypothetical protein